jgi:hypothetical protein
MSNSMLVQVQHTYNTKLSTKLIEIIFYQKMFSFEKVNRYDYVLFNIEFMWQNIF